MTHRAKLRLLSLLQLLAVFVLFPLSLYWVTLLGTVGEESLALAVTTGCFAACVVFLWVSVWYAARLKHDAPFVPGEVGRASRWQTVRMPAVPDFVIFPFIGLSALGLLVSFGVHITALVGNALAGNALPEGLFVLHMGIFVVWLPAVLVSLRLTGEYESRDFWKAALRGCPAWMKYMTFAFFGYAIVNFILFITMFEDNFARGFSGHWMAFYSAAFAILYSSTRAKAFDESHRGPLGDPTSSLGKFYEARGADNRDSEAKHGR